MAALSVAVVGAGIGGLAAALALAADGHAVRLIEKRTGFGESGAGIQLSPNAVKAMAALRLPPPRSAVEPAALEIRRIGSGRMVATMPFGREMRERYGAPYLVVSRADLHTHLLDAVRARRDVQFLVGRRVAGIGTASGGRPTLTIEGSSGSCREIDCDLVVGADGVASAVRASLGQAGRLRPSGFVAARAVLPIGALPDTLAADRTGLWWAADRHAVHYPIAGGRKLNLVVVERGALAGDGWSEPLDAPALQRRFANAAPPLRALLAAAEDWTGWRLAAPAAPWLGHDRVALLGDAAHPILPFFAQGGAMALEDAAVLAHALRRYDEPDRAVAAYARARSDRVRRVQSAAGRNGRIFHLGGAAAAARDLALRLRPPSGQQFDWLYGWEPPASA